MCIASPVWRTGRLVFKLSNSPEYLSHLGVHSSVGKESACNAGDLGSIPGLGRSPGEGRGYPLQYSGLENSMDCIVHRVTKSRTQLSDLHFQKCMMEDTCLIMVLLNVKSTSFSFWGAGRVGAKSTFKLWCPQNSAVLWMQFLMQFLFHSDLKFSSNWNPSTYFISVYNLLTFWFVKDEPEATVEERKSSEASLTAQRCKDRSKEGINAALDSPSKQLPDQISFFSGNPSVEIVHGIMHLYKTK